MTYQTSDLVDAQKKLAEVKAEYDNFVYIVSHDVGASFRHVEGFAQIILRNHSETLDDKGKRQLGLIIDASEKGKDRLDGILELSRLTTQEQPYTSVDCSKLVGEAKDALEALIAESDAEINCGDLPSIEADREQIGQVFYHLLKNALIYRDKSTQTIISVEAEQTPGQVRFSVKDNGIGVPPKQIEKIFGPLKRAVRDADYPGVGMGLTIAQKIVRRHGGDIWAEPETASGSAFHFTLSTEGATEG